MDIKVIRDNLGRVKAYYLKGENLRALSAAIMAFKEIINVPQAAISTPIRSVFREAVQLLARDEAITSRAKRPIIYQPGQEKIIFATLLDVYQQLTEEKNRETKEEKKARKLKLDKALNIGMRLLAQNKITEAELAFQEAIACYKDEHALFMMIAKAYFDSDNPKRALPYAKQATEVAKDPHDAFELIEKIIELKDKPSSSHDAAQDSQIQ